MSQTANIIAVPLSEIIGQSPESNYGTPTAGFRHWIVPAIECLDGTRLSVQASAGHYCSPRGDAAPYSSVEVGFPTADPGADWLPYKDNQQSGDFKDVYGYVPVELVKAFIEAHGGEKLPA